ncbi:hypothetical protein CJU90_3599 [Yarrowia sp. C11]|nr:hypothetical protein CJU90_3599 [Yarrowia sp. C11]
MDNILCKEKLYVDESSVVEDPDGRRLKFEDILDDSGYAVNYIFAAVLDALDEYLKEKSRKLGATATKEEALEAIQELISAFEPGLALVRNAVYAETQKFLSFCIRARRAYPRLIADRQDTWEEDSEIELEDVVMVEKEVPEKVLERYPGSRLTHIGLLQLRIWLLLKDKSQEVQDWWYLHNNPFTEHLLYPKEKRPEVEFNGVGARQTPLTSQPTLPLEIATIIMSQCSLESCVALRQVSRVFYQAFHLADLESSVKARCPWFRLEGELRSWSDCALVFVQRQNNDKWISIESLSDAEVRPLDETQPHVVEPIELELGEKLPADFEPVNRHTDGDDCPCDAIHFKKRYSRTDMHVEYKVLDVTKMTSINSTFSFHASTLHLNIFRPQNYTFLMLIKPPIFLVK